jgi:purine-binding chemotaxis protein CheW
VDIQELAKTVPVEGEVSLEGIDFISNGEEYLTFTLGQEHYGVDILSVNEIRGWEQPTLIPNSPDYIKGVINIRGSIIPIIDLRLRFSVGEVDYNPTTVVIILTIDTPALKCMMGFVVDTVSDVLNSKAGDIKKAPAFGGNIPSEMVEGIVNVGENVVTILVVEQLLTLENEEDV